MIRALTIFLALGIFSCSPTVYTHGVPNLVQVDPGVWRSGQPTTAAAWAYLKSLGIKRVVKLNFESEGTDDGARAVGMEVIYLPIEPNGDMLTVVEKPDAAHVEAAVKAIAEGGGVIFHCSHGQDRTGLLAGIHRVRNDHWPKSAAHREMLARGFHEELVGLDAYWQDDVRP